MQAIKSPERRAKRDEKLTPWVSKSEKNAVRKAAANAGLTLHDWCRWAFSVAIEQQEEQLQEQQKTA